MIMLHTIRLSFDDKYTAEFLRFALDGSLSEFNSFGEKLTLKFLHFEFAVATKYIAPEFSQVYKASHDNFAVYLSSKLNLIVCDIITIPGII